MAENPRIEELKRRVEKDPTSIAFAQLAEEYRRTGAYQLAVDVCRDGLSRHPGYLSARVTLARALMELDQFADAKTELQGVLAVAPDNLAAIRALADIHQKTGDIEETFHIEMRPPTRPPAPEQPPRVEEPPVVDDDAALSLPSLDLPPLPDMKWEIDPAPPAQTPEVDPVLVQLEGWLDAILADRAQTR